jgi:uncharacterized protein YqeY
MSESTLRQRLEDDLKIALKSGNQDAKDTIRFTLAAIKNAEIEKGGVLTEEESLTILRQQAKRRADAIDQFRSGNRADLVEREENQLRVLDKYLPASMSDDELKVLVAQAVGDVGATGPKDMGKLMPVLIERAAGRADGKRLSDAAREELSKLS